MLFIAVVAGVGAGLVVGRARPPLAYALAAAAAAAVVLVTMLPIAANGLGGGRDSN